MQDIRLKCAGCSVVKMYPSQCDGCPNYLGNCHKYAGLIKNYTLLINLINSNDELCKKSALNRNFGDK